VALKLRRGNSDVQDMSGIPVGKMFPSAVMLALCGWMGGVSLRAESVEEPPVFADEDDEALDIEFLKAGAAAGKVRAQTRLADFYLAGGDFTNAVSWYRKAAEQGDVAAQLTLATCLITGRGACKDTAEAARWLRQAADRIEAPAGGRHPVATAPVPTAPATPPVVQPILMTKAFVATNSMPTQPTNPPAPRSLTRVQRSEFLQPPEPLLQEPKPTLKSYTVPR
jgi:Sel1 repeat